ncbi:HNH endonuclease family protein [Actinocorallia populi]|uniref:HNH endonuclease family protein n=1 Tax=Actinocorallia populi TaxID=2079200 RepID=UPI000D088B39|nr:HNH endonuclease family protein [Actinocorallia populi]
MFRPLALAVGAVLLLGGCSAEPGTDPPDSSTRSPGTSGTESRGALEDLGSLRITGEGDGDGYDRRAFGTPWKDVDGNGCDTRNDILARDLASVTRDDDGCLVLTGVLEDDPYSGGKVSFTRSRPSQVQIDHVYPLALAWRMGADGWPEERRTEFANDPLNLLAVSGRPNQQKGDSGPAEWKPPADYQCTYAGLFVTVAKKYDLPATRADHTALGNFLKTC